MGWKGEKVILVKWQTLGLEVTEYRKTVQGGPNTQFTEVVLAALDMPSIAPTWLPLLLQWW
jgi:hypothetical protein